MYERSGNHAYVGSFQVGGGAVDGVSKTDGIDVAGARLGPAFPDGLFVAQDDENPGSHQNFKLVPWARIAGML